MNASDAYNLVQGLRPDRQFLNDLFRRIRYLSEQGITILSFHEDYESEFKVWEKLHKYDDCITPEVLNEIRSLGYKIQLTEINRTYYERIPAIKIGWFRKSKPRQERVNYSARQVTISWNLGE